MSHDDPMFTASLNQSDERKQLVERLRRNSRGHTEDHYLMERAADLLERDSIQLRECGEEVVQTKPQIEKPPANDGSKAKSGGVK